MVQAIWKGTVIADSDNTVVIENNHYFPADAVKKEFFKSSKTTSVCGWKGTAHYQSVVVDGAENTDAAWYYPEPKNAAEAIKGRIAFWKGVEIR